MKPLSRNHTLCIIAFTALATFSQANCHASRLVDVTLIDRTTGERLTTYPHQGKRYVAGTPGNHYAVELRNISGGRVLTVLSVDGINAITGQTANTSQSGYVLDQLQSHEINGWRKNMNDVAQFVFTAIADSYAARTGRPGNVGVIGVAVYREKLPPPQALAQAPAPLKRGSTANAEDSNVADSTSAAERQQTAKGLGTGHGEREYSPATHTEFSRASHSPEEVIALHYDSRANLIARGIIKIRRPALPNPFPGNGGFVPDPN